jgi:hypothetical protein
MKPVLASCFAALTVLSLSSSASAYCRTTTVARAAGMCPEACITDGDPLYWGVPDPLFTMNENGFPDFESQRTVVQIMSRSFDHWNDIECDGGSIGLDIRVASGTTPLEVGPMDDEPNENVVVFYDEEQWFDERLPDSAYALTAIWYNRANGEILGADMHFNGGMGRLTICPDSGCDTGDVDLENVATHEAGHFIGLAHSNEAGSTMLCAARPDEVEKRDLEADDIAGACAIYEGAADSPDGWLNTVSLNAGVRPPGRGGSKKGCSLAPGTQASGLSGLLLALAVLGLRRRTARLMK